MDQRGKMKENENQNKRDKYQDIAKEQKKTIEHESDGDTTYNWRARYSYQRIDIMTGRLGNIRTSGDHTNYYIIEVGQNTEKSPGDLK